MSDFFRTRIDRDEVPSTSDLARSLVESGSIEMPAVVSARRQTAGRGRGDHRWFSDEGSLTFTIALDPEAHGLRRDHEPRVALAVAVGLIAGVGPLPGAEIRWPNDVEVRGKKLAGILPERIETDSGPRLLIGVGLNVATDLDASPAEVRAMASTLRMETGRPHDASEILDAFLDRFPALVGRLAGDDDGLAREWAGLDALKDRPVRLILGDEVVEGLGAGIDATGGLRVATGSGVRVFHGGQVARDRSGIS